MTTLTPTEALAELRRQAATEEGAYVTLDAIDRVMARTRNWYKVHERTPKCPITHPRTGHKVSNLVLVAKGDRVLEKPHYLRADDGQWFPLDGGFATPGITDWTPYPAR